MKKYKKSSPDNLAIVLLAAFSAILCIIAFLAADYLPTMPQMAAKALSVIFLAVSIITIKAYSK